MIVINQITAFPRVVRGLAILTTPNNAPSRARQVAGLIPLQVLEDDCRGQIEDCFIVLADAVDTDTRKNDTSSFVCDFTDDTGGNLYKLQQFYGGSWSDIESPFVSGTFYGYNTWDAHQTRAGIKVDWRTVLNTYGIGLYRVVVDNLLFSYPISLRAWGCQTDTVKLDITFNGLFGKIDGQGYHVFNVGDSEQAWTESVRYTGGFGRLSDSVETEIYRYKDEFQQTNRRELKNSFQLHVYGNNEMFNRLLSYGLMSSYINVTEYNENTGKYYTEFDIQYNSGETEKSYHEYTNKAFRLSAIVERAVDNLGHRKCI